MRNTALLALTLAACSSSTNPPVAGEGILVDSSSKVSVDTGRVPVVPACAAGQVVRRSADGAGWECKPNSVGFAAVTDVPAFLTAGSTVNVQGVSGGAPVNVSGGVQVTGNVGIIGNTMVTLSGIPQVSLSGTPSVALSGTPAVALAAGTTVQATRPGDDPNNLNFWGATALSGWRTLSPSKSATKTTLLDAMSISILGTLTTNIATIGYASAGNVRHRRVAYPNLGMLYAELHHLQLVAANADQRAAGLGPLHQPERHHQPGLHRRTHLALNLALLLTARGI